MRPASAFQFSMNPVEVYEFKVESSGRGPSISWSYGRRAGSVCDEGSPCTCTLIHHPEAEVVVRVPDSDMT